MNIFQRTELSTRIITHLCWCNWRTFWRKNAQAAGRSPRGSCSYSTMSRLTGHLQPRRNWPTWVSNVIDHPPYSPNLVPSDYHLFPGLKKTIERSPFFRPIRRSMLPRRPGWTGNILNFFFFGVACRSYSNGLRSVLSFVGSMLNKSRVWSL